LSNGKLLSEIIFDISFTNTVDSTVDVRLIASSAADTTASKVFYCEEFP